MIANILKEHGAIGKAHGMNINTLMDIVNMNRRSIIADVRKERAAGTLICSDTVNGYYLPGSVEEVAEFVAVQEKRIVSHAVSVKTARQYLKESGREQVPDGKEGR